MNNMAAFTCSRVFLSAVKPRFFGSLNRVLRKQNIQGQRCFSHERPFGNNLIEICQKYRRDSSYNGYVFAGLMLLGFTKKEEEDPVTALFREARIAQHERDYDKAEHLFHRALQLASENHGKQDMSEKDFVFARINIYDSLADMALSRGLFDKAEKLYKETMKSCFETGVGTDDNSIIEMSIKLASIYAMQRRHDEAVKGFEYCITVQEKKVKDMNDTDKDTMALYGLSLESYGRYLMYQRKLEEAVPIIEKALTVSKATLGEEHAQTLVLHNDIATLNILRKNYGPAEETLKHAIKIGEKVNASEVPALYSNLGALYLRRSELDAARDACNKAFQLATKLKDKLSAAQAQKCLKKIEEITKKKRVVH